MTEVQGFGDDNDEEDGGGLGLARRPTSPREALDGGGDDGDRRGPDGGPGGGGGSGVRSRGSGSSGPPLANFTTLVGPRSSIQRLQRVWFGLIGLRGVLVDGALPPRFLDAGGPGEERTTVASVRHRPGVPGR